MDKHRRKGYWGYRLISAKMMLDESNKHEEIATEKFNLRLKGFHVFCVIIFSAFLLDGFLPYSTTETKIDGTRPLQYEEKMILLRGKEQLIRLPSLIQINTPHGAFITSEFKGYEYSGQEIYLKKTPIFKIIQRLEYEGGYTVDRYFNYFGRFIFWPLLSLFLSLSFLLIRSLYGNNTISVLTMLNLVPFFIVLYMT
jgi:hypothetical protein